MKLRPYQKKALDNALAHLQKSNSTLLVMATGTGKTVVFSHLAALQEKRTLILAHRKELVDQAANKLLAITGVSPEIEMASSYSDESSLYGTKFVVASIQTMIAGHAGGLRMERFRPVEFGLIVIDEAHHSSAASYRQIIEYFTANTDCKVLGVTATPDRGDKRRLGDIFESVAMDYGILVAIRDGWLVPINQRIVDVESLSFDNVGTRGGDFIDSDLAIVMKSERVLHGVVTPSVGLVGNKQTVVFCASVDHAERMAEIWNRSKPGCAKSISGKTTKTERIEMLKDFSERKFQVLTSCMVLTEGWDCPHVEAIVMARPTKSRALYAQMLGRGTRPLPGVVDGVEDRIESIANSEKKELLVLDFCGNSTKHKLICAIDLLAGEASNAAITIAKKKARSGGSTETLLEEAEDDVQSIERKKKEKLLLTAAKNKALVASAEWRTSEIDPFSFTQTRPHREQSFSGDKQMSDKMKTLLAKNGMNPASYSYAAAQQICGEVIRRLKGNLCTVKQAHYLKQYGFDTNISRESANTILTAKWGGRNR